MNSQTDPLAFLQTYYSNIVPKFIKFRWQFALLLGIFITFYEINEHRAQIPPITLPFIIELGLFSLLIPLLVGGILTLLAQSEQKRQQVATNQRLFEKVTKQIIAVDSWPELCEIAVRFPNQIAPFSYVSFLYHKDAITESFHVLSQQQNDLQCQIEYPSKLIIPSIKHTLNNSMTEIIEIDYPDIAVPDGYVGYCFPFFTDYVCFAMLHLFLPTSYQLSEKEISNLNGLMPALFFAILRLAPISSKDLVGVEKERVRLARHLHDSVGQNLGLLLMKMDIYKKQSRSIQSNQSQSLLSEMQQVANEAYEQVRFTLTNLQPSNTQDLAATIYQVSVLIAERQSDLEVQMKQEGHPVDLPLTTKQRIVAICRESLTNIVKHAQATKIEILMNWKKEFLVVSIIDDGLGLKTKEEPSESFGLHMMFERAAEIGATLKLKSRMEKGLEIELRMPLPNQKIESSVKDE